MEVIVIISHILAYEMGLIHSFTQQIANKDLPRARHSSEHTSDWASLLVGRGQTDSNMKQTRSPPLWTKASVGVMVPGGRFDRDQEDLRVMLKVRRSPPRRDQGPGHSRQRASWAEMVQP